MDRLNRLRGHITQSSPLSANVTSAATAKHADDIVIVCAVRTAICQAKRGKFKDTHPTELLAPVLNAVCERVNLDKSVVDDILVGNVLTPGAFAVQAKMASFMAGFPQSVSVQTVNRQCSSGLQAVATIAAAIQTGQIDCGIAAGVESMSTSDMMGSVGAINNKIFTNADAKACIMPMGITSENVAAKYGVSRAQQDAMAVESHRRALQAQKEGRFNNEIVPVTTTFTDRKSGEKSTITVTADDGPREGITAAGVAKLKAVFQKGGSTTAGNASQMSDGAGAVLLMKRSKANQLNLPIEGTFVSFAVKGVDPLVMGIGPAVAIPAALQKANLNSSDIDVWEINEAFASQATYCVNKLQIPMSKVNVNGGAIALGHPLGATGARMVSTLLNELKRQKKTTGVVSMCIGTGMGAAAVFRRE